MIHLVKFMLRNIFFFIKPILAIFLLMGNLYAVELSIIPSKKPVLDKEIEEKKLSQGIIVPKSKPVENIEEPSTPTSPVLEEVRETFQENETVLKPERSIESDFMENVEGLNEESIELENGVDNINMEVVPNVADRTNEMLKSMRIDLHMNKKRFVNPYRLKHQMNEKRQDRLRNIRVKKNSGLGLSQYL